MLGNRLFGLGIAIVALVYMASATQIPVGFLADPVGPRAFPLAVGAIALICAACIGLKPDVDPSWPHRGLALKIVIAIAVMAGFAQLLRPLGFLIPAAVACALLSYLISPRPVRAAITGIALSIGLFGLFNMALGLSLAPFGRAFGG